MSGDAEQLEPTRRALEQRAEGTWLNQLLTRVILLVRPRSLARVHFQDRANVAATQKSGRGRVPGRAAVG